MTTRKSVLIVGEVPENMDFSDPAIPKGVTPQTIRDGLEKSLEALREKGRIAELVYVDTKDTAEAELTKALASTAFDVVVVGAGLRVVPKQTEMFEVVMNVLRVRARSAKLAFNTSPDDSANAAERQLAAPGQV